MINLIKADLYKLFKNRGVIISLILNMIFAMASVMAVSFLTKLAQVKGDQAELNGFLCMTEGFTGAGVIALIMAIAVTVFVTSDFSYGTMKYPIAKGFSRTELYFSSLIAASVLGTIMLLSYVIITTATATALWGFGDFNPDLLIGSLNVILIQLLLCISLAAFFLMISMLIKNSAGAVAFNIVTVLFLADLICTAINYLADDAFDSSIYWIIDNMVRLTSATPAMIDVSRGLLVAVAYFTICTIIGCTAFNQYEFK